ncbi:MAG: response regulator [Myxococcales bacterium]|nr:response regulator [Myxococcales bacterium]
MSGDDEGDERERRIRFLGEQVKLLVRTEQRLYRTQRSLEAQLRRMGALSELTRFASHVASEPELLSRVARLALSLFPFEQVAIWQRHDDGVIRAVYVDAVAGRSYDAERRREDVLVRDVTLPSAATLVEPGATAPPTLDAMLDAMESLFAEPGAARRPACAALAVPLRVDGRAQGVLLARKVDPVVQPHTPLPTEEDRAFLELLESHLESALASVRLRARMQTVLGHLPSAILVLRGGRVVQTNAAALRVLGCDAEAALLGARFVDLVPAEERDAYAQLEDDVARQGSLRLLDRRLVGRDGAVRPVELVALPLTFEGGPATLLIADDLAERDRMRTELAFADRLATVGALAAGVAHEVNNPLTFVLIHLERLAQVVPEAERARALAALDGATRIRDIVRDLQTFTRAETTRVDAVNVHAVLDKVLALAAPELRYRARVERDFGPHAWVRGNEGRLAQVFLNLVINAAHAMDEDQGEARLRISTRGERGGVEVTDADTHPDRVVIEMSDTGRGIPPADLARIFEPFFSTKPSGVGSGLGLSICRNIVEAHGGTIEVESRVGRGTRFTLRLPAACPHAIERIEQLVPAGDRARVLLIDDDPRVLEVLASEIADVHDVETAVGGALGISALERRTFDAVACDLMMPGVDGVDVYEWLQLHRPELLPHLFFVTGGAFTGRGEAFLARARPRVLSKPVQREGLLAMIDEARAGFA